MGGTESRTDLENGVGGLGDGPVPVLEPGRTCWRIERADRLALIVDAADYFAAVKAALLQARHQVILIGWDFDVRIKLAPDQPEDGTPDELGGFLTELARRRPGLRVHILKWDMAAAGLLLRGRTPLVLLKWLFQPRIRFRLAVDHPVGACHHMKLVVIDDALAFCGSIDMTTDRWDRPAHSDENPYRIRPDGTAYGPFHDVTAALGGTAAQALGELARRRWERATGERLPPPPVGEAWPPAIEPLLCDVDVAIARTEGAFHDRPEVREIEALYLAAIRSARRHIYIESQYFASESIAAALAQRLGEPDGPDVVVVNPKTAQGWLEEVAMSTARAVLLERLRRADRFDRFRIYTPVTRGGADIYVHAKVLAIDDTLLRLGSSNVNNRSMGFDTECDLALEAAEGAPNEAAIRAAVGRVRDMLLAEHLDRTPEEVASVLAATGSLVQAVERLCRSTGRTLVPLVPPVLSETEADVGAEKTLDPDRPEEMTKLVGRGLRDVAALTLARMIEPWRRRPRASGPVPPRRKLP